MYDVLFILYVRCLHRSRFYTYLLVYYPKKQVSKRLFALSAQFFSIYIVGFYVLSLHVGRGPAKDMALFFLLPSLAVAHWALPFKKSKTVGKLLLSLAGIYILFLILLSLMHGFSRM